MASVHNPLAARCDREPGALSAELLTAARERTAEAADRAESLEGALHEIDPTAFEGNGLRTAFWLNLYNALILREMRARPRSGSLVRHRRIFRRWAYRVGSDDYSLDAIEHGLLRRNARPPYGLRRVLGGDDPRLAAAPSVADPKIHFALNCGARSCPPSRVYDPGAVECQLDEATRAYLSGECEFDREAVSVTLPGLIKLYRADFGGRAAQLELVAAQLPEHAGWLAANRDQVMVRYARFDWTIASAGIPSG